MKLQIESIDIKGIEVGSMTTVSDHVLYINAQELEKIILKDNRIKSVEITIVNPGDNVRIVNVVDIIQPRCKIDRANEDFPGWLGKLTLAGKGRTRSLRGFSVVLSNRYSKRPYSALIDMFGIGAEMSLYGRMTNLSIDPIPSENTAERDFESAVKLAGLKTAVYLAKAADGCPIDHYETYELEIPNLPTGKKRHLPRVAHYYQLFSPQHDYQGIPDPILYGTQVTNLLPTILHPNEVFDGAILSPHTIRKTDTYTIQNHPVIKELYKRHGKELIFTGVVIGVASLDPIQRQRMAMMAANLISNVLGSNGVILTKVHGGIPQVDLGLVAQACEEMGVKTTLFAQLWSSIGSLSDYTLYGSDSLNAVINIGQTLERIRLAKADRILGGTSETSIYNPDFTQKAGDELIEVEGFLLAGVYDMLGSSKIVAVEY
jgi:hypothetical protein